MTTRDYKRRRIRELSKEIATIEEFYYSFVDEYGQDPDAQIYALRTKRAFLVRALIMEEHLAIEDTIDMLLKRAFVSFRTKKKRKAKYAATLLRRSFPEAEALFTGNSAIGFKRKIVLLRTLGLISKAMLADLDALNSLRNRCGHHWQLEGVLRRRKQKTQPKKFTLAYQGQSLFIAANLIKFLLKYRDVYFDLLDLTFDKHPMDFVA